VQPQQQDLHPLQGQAPQEGEVQPLILLQEPVHQEPGLEQFALVQHQGQEGEQPLKPLAEVY